MNRGANRTARRGLDGLKARAFAKAKLCLPLLDSVVPTKGSVPMSFTRASVRRELDYSGLFVELLSGEVGFRGGRRVRNLASNSENLKSASWTGNGGGTGTPATCTAGFTDPNGGDTAFRVVANKGAGTATTDFSFWSDASLVFAGNQIRPSWWIKSNTGATQNVAIMWTGVDGNNVIVATNEWRRVTNAVPKGLSGPSAALVIGARATFGDDAIDVLVWHPQLEDVTGQANQNPGEYVPVGAAKENDLLQTENFAVGPWGTVSATVAYAPANRSPRGSPATLITPTASSGRASQTVTYSRAAGVTARAEFDLKNNGLGGIAIFIYDSGGADYAVAEFNLGTGVAGFLGGNNTTRLSTIANLGDGWYRCRLDATFTNSGAGYFIQVRETGSFPFNGSGVYATAGKVVVNTALMPSDSYLAVGNVYPFSGAMADGVKWFTRENPNIVVGNVVQEITGVAVPEIPYPQVLKGYVPMPAATNLLTYSGDLTNAAWTKAASVASIATYPPRLLKESLPSQLRDDSTAASIHGMFRNPTVVANTNYCAWLVVHSSGERFRGRIGFLDAATSSNGVICEFNARTGVTNAAAVGTGTLAGSGYINAAKGWGIVYVSGKIDAATTAAQVQLLLADSAGNLTYNGDGVSRMILGHFQLEAGTVPTNIIPTTSAAVTVANDALTLPPAGVVATGTASGALSTEVEMPKVFTDIRRTAVFVDDDGLDRLVIRVVDIGTAWPIAVVGTGAALETENASALSDGARSRLALSYGAAGASFMNDAVAATGSTGAATNTASPSVMTIGGYGVCTAYFRSWTVPLTDAELKAITANGYRDQTINTLGWVDSPQISHDGRRLYFMYSRYDFAPLLIDGAGLEALGITGSARGWHVAIPHPSYDADVYCAYLRHDGTVERIENLRFDPNYDDFTLQVASAESSIMEVAATASLPKRVYYNANRYGDVPKLVYRQENADGSWTAESTSELATVSGGGSGAGYIDDNAFVSDSRLELVFASTRPGGQGSSDLWRSTRAGPTDVWGAPANIGANINTAGHEDQVFLHPNGVDCWFTRDGGIYHCTRAGAAFNNDDTLVTFTGTPLAGGIGEPSTDEAMTGLYFSYLELSTKRIRIMRAPWTGSKTAWGTPVAVD